MDSQGSISAQKMRALICTLLLVVLMAVSVAILSACGLSGASSAESSVNSAQETTASLMESSSSPSDEAVDLDQSDATAQPACISDAGYESGHVLADLPQNVTLQQVRDQCVPGGELEGMTVEPQDDSMVKVMLPSGMEVEDALAELSDSELLLNVQPDYHYYVMDDLSAGEVDLADDAFQTFATTNDPSFATQWGLKHVNLPAAWDYVASNRASGTKDVMIAVIDQGFYANHPDLSGQVYATYNAVTGTTDVSGNASHGTHVAGIVAARSNNGVGISGAVNNQCKLVLVKVGDSQGRILTSYLENAYKYLEKLQSQGANVRVANVSLGSKSSAPIPQKDNRLYNAIASATNKKIVTVAAAGNQFPNDPILPYYVSPGDFDNVVSVINLQEGSSNADGVERNDSSNYNVAGQTGKNIAAPGTSIISTYYSGNTASYQRLSGTSMASPLVAGVMGLMFTINPNLKADEAPGILYATARDLKAGEFSSGWDRYSGYGEVNASAAVKASRTDPVIRGNNQAFCGASTTFTVTQGGVAQKGYTWASSNPAIATINSAGKLVGKKPGKVVIRAKAAGYRLEKLVTVFGISGKTTAKSGQSVKYSIAPESLGTWRWRLSSTAYASINATTGKLTVKQASKARKVTVTVIATAQAGKGLATKATLKQKVTLTITEKITKKPVYRLYNPKTGVRYYTIKASSRKAMVKKGWRNQGTAWTTPSKSKTPVYQLYHKKTGRYYYTKNKSTVKKFKKQGWRSDGIVWYANDKHKTKVYCEAKKTKRGYIYNYTKSAAQHKKMLKQGWRSKGVVWYAL